MKIQPIVEGHGEVDALPVLLRRLRDEAGAYVLEVAPPIRQKRGRLVKHEHLQTALSLARKRSDCCAILIVFDADNDCPKDIRDAVEPYAQKVSASVPCKVVIPKPEYEAWFLAAIASLRGKRGIRDDATAPEDPESIRDAKGLLERRMNAGWSYLETVDQAKFSAVFDMKQAYRRCRSFRRLVKAFGELAHGMGIDLAAWPPPAWLEESGKSE